MLYEPAPHAARADPSSVQAYAGGQARQTLSSAEVPENVVPEAQEALLSRAHAPPAGQGEHEALFEELA